MFDFPCVLRVVCNCLSSRGILSTSEFGFASPPYSLQSTSVLYGVQAHTIFAFYVRELLNAPQSSQARLRLKYGVLCQTTRIESTVSNGGVYLETSIWRCPYPGLGPYSEV